jgi:ATP synthase protein I
VGEAGKPRRPVSGSWRAASAGSQLVVIFLFGFFGGRWLDAKLHSTPWLTVVGIILGFGVGIVAAYRTYGAL